jgi:putative transposase
LKTEINTGIIFNIMPRQQRIIIPDIPHHVTQRGNNGQDVFFSPDDRKRYLRWIIQYTSKYEFDIIAYCLMTNHVHFVGIPRKMHSIARTFQIVQMMHCQAVNKARGRDGHLWHSPYGCAPMDNKHMWLAIRYVEQNPLRAGIVDRAIDYPYSSARAHCGLSDDPVLAQGIRLHGAFDNWKETLREVPDRESIELIKNCTMRGLPCGEKRFVKRVFSLLSDRTKTIKRR